MRSDYIPVATRNALARCILREDPPKRLGRPRTLSSVEALSKIMFVYRTGRQWSAIQGIDGVSYKTVHHRFKVWSKLRLFEHAFYDLSKEYRRRTHHPIILRKEASQHCHQRLFGRYSSVARYFGEWRICSGYWQSNLVEQMLHKLRYYRGSRSLQTSFRNPLS